VRWIESDHCIHLLFPLLELLLGDLDMLLDGKVCEEGLLGEIKSGVALNFWRMNRSGKI